MHQLSGAARRPSWRTTPSATALARSGLVAAMALSLTVGGTVGMSANAAADGAFKPYFGEAAGNQLTALLRRHILGAVDVLVAAKAGDEDKLATAVAAWYANGQEIADFLSAANPKYWPQAKTRALMREHLDTTLKEATDRLKGDFAADIKDYDVVHHHILVMADFLSCGVISRFPDKFGQGPHSHENALCPCPDTKSVY